MDLIDRQAAISAIVGMTTMGIEELVIDVDEEEYDWIKGLSDSLVKIINLPSAEPEIIRCKDCKHRPFDSEDTQGFGVVFPDEKCPCQCEDFWYNWRPNDEWFCANAERRTDE